MHFELGGDVKAAVKTRFDSRIFLGGSRNQVPLQEESSLAQLRTFSQGLLIVPIVIALLFGSGHLALILNSNIPIDKAYSSLSAEYGPWVYFPVRALRDGIINEVKLDFIEKTDIGEVFHEPVPESGRTWLEEPSGPIIPSTGPVVPTPTDQSESGIMPTVTPLPTQPSGSPPTAISPQPTSTSVPVPPSTPTPTTNKDERFPSDDAWVRVNQPGNDGLGNHLKIQNPNKISFLKFSLNGLTCTDSTVTLVLITSQEKPGTVHLHRVAYDDWHEASLEGTNAPDIGDRIGSAVSSGVQWEEVSWDVTTYICQTIQNGKTTIAFALLMTEGEQVYFSSKDYREGVVSPRLVFSASS